MSAAPSIESLEPRRLLAADITLTVNLTVGAHKPGASAVYGAFTARNGGDQIVTTDFNVEIHLSKNTVYGDSDDIFGIVVPMTETLIVSTIGGALKPFGFNVAANVPAGPYYVVLKADSGNAVAENNENNNTVAGFLGVVTHANGTVPVWGTDGPDSITFTQDINFTHVDVNGLQMRLLNDQTSAYDIQGFGGNDVIVMSGNLPNVNAHGGDGDDKIVGSDGPDTISGSAGKDTLFGMLGNDRLNGNGGHDRLFGDAGADRLYGYDGNDAIDGGSSGDRLEGGGGTDTFFGQGGNDRFFTSDGIIESVFGGSGIDTLSGDATDILSAIETVV